MPSLLKFVPFSSNVDVSFWSEFAKQKIDILRLNDDPLTLHGSYSLCAQFPLLEVDFLALRSGVQKSFESVANAALLEKGLMMATITMINANTMPQYLQLDRQKLFDDLALEIFHSIRSGEALKNPELLTRFLLLTFADLKKYHFYSLLGCPALKFPIGDVHFIEERSNASLSEDNLWQTQLKTLYSLLHSATNVSLSGFVVSRSATTEEVLIFPLSEYMNVLNENEKNKTDFTTYVAFADSSSLPLPGWTLRNLLFLVAYHFHVTNFDVLCFRETSTKKCDSCTFSVVLPEIPKDLEKMSAVGWEFDPKKPEKTKTKIAKLGNQMNPIELATTAADLNLKLMRWRMFAEIDLEMIQKQRCLLVGAGTLGCNVARTLLGWGIRTITFLDQARVSFSNPPRQSLFNFEDCFSDNGNGEYKSIAAANAMKKIFPGMNVTGEVMSIPMPGHSVDRKNDKLIESTKQTVDKLDSLIENHDVVFLLGDSKEVRWLPTVIAQAKNKLVINAGLGFDSYVVMRHGMRGGEGVRPSCYFCSDVDAPKDSISDRTLDQACTVTRPGISMIASALAVELYISVLHHPKQGLAPAEASEALNTSLGSVPQQIRGFLSQWKTLVVSGDCYTKCTACSDPVVNAYQSSGFDFVLDVLNTPSVLEELTGIKQEKASEVKWEFSQEDDF